MHLSKHGIPNILKTVQHIRRLNIILVAEGAIDRAGQPISAEDVKKVNKRTREYVWGGAEVGTAVTFSAFLTV